MAHAEAEAYKDPGTPEEQSRRTFMVNAVIALGGVISLGLAVPLITSLIPAGEAVSNQWSPLTPDEFSALQKATDNPIKVTFTLHRVDGYLPPEDDEEFVWAVKADLAQFKKDRPELFAAGTGVSYPIVNMGFTIFSPICPHLGCRYSWVQAQNKFVCPCHGSEYSNIGTHLAGPAPRGLDPLPLRDLNGKAELTWIEYKQDTPDLVVLRIG
ncbi:MAG: ubiquinol-cytochrome c reductase iron-sulfur subunit [Candidatus Lustribacter sp.]|jgi:menaquinol-cytochrome c reductase iron-sulfur subunit